MGKKLDQIQIYAPLDKKNLPNPFINEKPTLQCFLVTTTVW